MAGLLTNGARALMAAAAPNLATRTIGYSLLEGVGSALLIPPVHILWFTVAGPLIGGLHTSEINWRAFVGAQAPWWHRSFDSAAASTNRACAARGRASVLLAPSSQWLVYSSSCTACISPVSIDGSRRPRTSPSDNRSSSRPGASHRCGSPSASGSSSWSGSFRTFARPSAPGQTRCWRRLIFRNRVSNFRLDPLADDGAGLLSTEDAERLAGKLGPNESAALMLFENTWTRKFVEALRRVNSSMVLYEHIPRAVMEQLMAAQADMP